MVRRFPAGRYFNPRSPDGERRGVAPGGAHMFRISIHAPRMGSDLKGAFILYVPSGFQSTLPGWGATSLFFARHIHHRISIHAPRMGSDSRLLRVGDELRISIHAPRMGSDRENGHLRPRYGQNHPFSTLIVSQIVVDVLGTVRKSQKTPAH